MNNMVNLYNLTRLSNDFELSKNYVSYICSFSKNKQYRHEEITGIKKLISNLNLDNSYYDNFYYSYNLEILNKEFDLIKVSNKNVLNIELKTINVGENRILKQLMQNRYYLKLIGKPIISITYIHKTNTLYELVDDSLKEISFDRLKEIFKENKEIIKVNLDNYYTSDNIVRSPIQAPSRFINKDYILTETQNTIKERILNNFDKYKIIGLTGLAGTGKTLLLYDISRELENCLIIHSTLLTNGHKEIENKLKISIISYVDLFKTNLDKYKYIFVDEAFRLSVDEIKYIISKNINVIFAYDEYNVLDNDTVDYINEVIKFKYKLTYKIRCNEEISSFIDCLFNLNKFKHQNFNHIHLSYFENKDEARNYFLSLKDVTYISPEAKSYLNNKCIDEMPIVNHISGLEYDKVAMILDESLVYINNKLCALNDKGALKKNLYLGLTRARKEIYIGVLNPKILKKLLKLF